MTNNQSVIFKMIFLDFRFRLNETFTVEIFSKALGRIDFLIK